MLDDTQKKEDLLANEVADKIRKKIKYQEYKSGDRLTVRKLCTEFGTSETPVKQALNQLMSTGLVVAIPKCGMKVRTFDIQDMKDILEARKMVEQFCVSDAVNTVKKDEYFSEKIENLLRLSNECYEKCILDYTRDNFYLCNEKDRDLHDAIVQTCHNKQILSIYENLNTHAGMFIGFDAHTPETLEQVILEHQDIVRCLLMCNEKEMKSAIENHVYSTIQIFRKKLYHLDKTETL